eukprot:scaffold365786_cov34-Prasinocladus_malaysianus.AAC.1
MFVRVALGKPRSSPDWRRVRALWTSCDGASSRAGRGQTSAGRRPQRATWRCCGGPGSRGHGGLPPQPGLQPMQATWGCYNGCIGRDGDP